MIPAELRAFVEALDAAKYGAHRVPRWISKEKAARIIKTWESVADRVAWPFAVDQARQVWSSVISAKHSVTLKNISDDLRRALDEAAEEAERELAIALTRAYFGMDDEKAEEPCGPCEDGECTAHVKGAAAEVPV